MPNLMLRYGLGIGHGALKMGKGEGVKGKEERLNLFLFPLTFSL